MLKIDAAEVAGENCVTLEDGQRLYELIHPELAGDRPVQLDFAGTEVFASPFFNAAIGQLLRDIAPETLNRRLEISHLSAPGLRLLGRVIENAKNYYSSEELKQASNQALGDDDADEIS